MLIYNKVLLDSIERERAGLDYCCPDADRAILCDMFKEINEKTATNIHYLAEVDSFDIKGAGDVMARYITDLSSESVRSFLIPQIVSDNVNDCDKLLLQLYRHFKASDEYISKPGHPSPAHIYVRYDNAFNKLKPKKLIQDLIELAHNHRDMFYLPFTIRMLASWKIPELYELLFLLLSDPDSISAQSVELQEDITLLPFIKRQLQFTAIDGLKYYPSSETTRIIQQYMASSDSDIRMAAKRTLKVLKKATNDSLP